MLSTRWRFVLVAAALITAVAGAVAATMSGGDKIKQFEGVQVGPGEPACTSALEFAEMPGTALSFDTPRDVQVVLLFQGQFGGFSSTPDARAVVRLTIDGAIAGSATAIGNDHGTSLETFGYNSFTTVGAGTHVAKVEWHTFPPGATSCVEERSLILLRP